MEMTAFLACPGCRGDVTLRADAFRCDRCGRSYPVVDEVPQFDPPATSDSSTGDDGRDERRTYWDRGWQARMEGDHAFLKQLRTRSDWQAYLAEASETYAAARHVSCVEAGRAAVEGKVVLDIGCGSGTSGAMFGYYGAHYIGVDHSREAAVNMLRHVRSVGGDGFTVQGNAESLPIRDDSIDVVYSNGVLHHTPNFRTAMSEAYRVVKPGGKAVIALYATYSTQFGLDRLLGILRGNLSRKAMDRWMGATTEGAWRTGSRLNPWTQTFSATQLRQVAKEFQISGLVIRKNGHPIGDLARYGSRLMKYSAFRQLDLALEPALGSMLVMSFEKPARER